MRPWLLTNHTYGTWLPGDPRGSVTSVRDRRSGDPNSATRFEHDLPGEPVEGEMPGLMRSALERMSGPPVHLDLEKAELVLKQFQETAAHRGWDLRAVAIMPAHFHIVVLVSGDPPGPKVLADFKAYGTRALNRRYGRPPSETWWTDKGSKRKLANEEALAAAIRYVVYDQPGALVVWSAELGRLV